MSLYSKYESSKKYQQLCCAHVTTFSTSFSFVTKSVIFTDLVRFLRTLLKCLNPWLLVLRDWFLPSYIFQTNQELWHCSVVFIIISWSSICYNWSRISNPFPNIFCFSFVVNLYLNHNILLSCSNHPARWLLRVCLRMI